MTLSELNDFIKINKLDHIFYINKIGQFNTFSINNDGQIWKIIYIDWRGPEIQFQTCSKDEAIKKYISYINSYIDK